MWFYAHINTLKNYVVECPSNLITIKASFLKKKVNFTLNTTLHGAFKLENEDNVT